MTHSQAVAAMLAVTLMWSIAGVVTRQLDAARSFEITFWRSAFNAVALALMLGVLRGPATLVASIRGGGRTLWLSGLCWSVMFTAFMVAITLTTVANVLVTMAIAPLVTALIARAALKHRLPARTWVAIVAAGVGIAWMYGAEVSGAEPPHLLGTLVALGVPLAAAVNWTAIQAITRRHGASRPPSRPKGARPCRPRRCETQRLLVPSMPARAGMEPRHSAPSGGSERSVRGGSSDAPDMLPAVLIGALLSAAATLPLALPFAASAHDLALLALLGVVQLAIPCLISVACAKVLSAPEIALLALLEVVFGVAWAWLGAGEQPGTAVLGGGALVLGALAANEALALRGQRAG